MARKRTDLPAERMHWKRGKVLFVRITDAEKRKLQRLVLKRSKEAGFALQESEVIRRLLAEVFAKEFGRSVVKYG